MRSVQGSGSEMRTNVLRGCWTLPLSSTHALLQWWIMKIKGKTEISDICVKRLLYNIVAPTAYKFYGSKLKLKVNNEKLNFSTIKTVFYHMCGEFPFFREKIYFAGTAHASRFWRQIKSDVRLRPEFASSLNLEVVVLNVLCWLLIGVWAGN